MIAMLCLFQGRPPAQGQELLSAIRRVAGPCEQRATVSYAKEGRHRRLALWERPWSTSPKETVEPFFLWVSPSLGVVSLALFTDRFVFGNGVTTGRSVRLTSGRDLRMSWIVFGRLLSEDTCERLRQVMEP